MANELSHKSVGAELSQAEWEAGDTHIADGQLANDLLYFNGTAWVRATPATIAGILNWAADITTHAALATGVHGVGASTVAALTTKLDDFAAPDDNTDLNASTSAHGLLPKLDNVATNFLNGQGAWAVPAAISSKQLSATRDIAAASGAVSYTGVGFAPTTATLFASNRGARVSFGVVDSAGVDDCMAYGSGSTWDKVGILAYIDVTSGNRQEGTWASWDADGMTITWTKTGSPTGTMDLVFLYKK